jgi:hypothetical protein
MERAENQPPVHIYRDTWEAWAPESSAGRELLTASLDTAEGGLSRTDVVDSVRDELLLVVPLASMWGSGTGVRARAKYLGQVLEDPEAVRGALQRMLEAVEQGPESAFEALWRPDNYTKPAILGFGTSFGTKLLSFLDEALADRGEADPCLIYDLMVCRTLAATRAQWPASISGDGERTFDPPTECVRFATYAAWCRLATEVARVAGCTPSDVEYTFFRVGQQIGTGVQLPKSGCGGRPRAEAPQGDDEDEAQALPDFDEPLATNVEELTDLLKRI